MIQAMIKINSFYIRKDEVISVRSLFIKSNVVGLGVSMGWLFIKGDFGEF